MIDTSIGATSTNNRVRALPLFVILAAAWIMIAMIQAILAPSMALHHYFLLTQDVPVAAISLSTLYFVSNWPVTSRQSLPWSGRTIAAIILALAALAWAGHYVVFDNYALSRDENLSDFAMHYLRNGQLGSAIPEIWRPYREAIMPAFMNQIGGDRFWISGYLPGYAAIQALVSLVADPALTGPVMLAIGLAALWRVASRLFPDRPDARHVTMVMALTSSQLIVTAMTPYAMTGHFALNMLWLALFLRDDRRGHIGAVAVAILALGLHKVQFHIFFAGPILACLLYRRRWALAAAYFLAYVILTLFWLRGFALSTIYYLGADTHAIAPMDRQTLAVILGSMSPLIYLSRFLAWNNILLLPFAAIGSFYAFRYRKGGEFTKADLIFMALACGCAIGLCLLVKPGHGWGYRYLSGFMGSFCLLAGLGWTHFQRASGKSLRIVHAMSLVAVATLIIQMVMAHNFVDPYARAFAAARAMPADVVIVDARTSAYGQDIIRLSGEGVSRPVLMDIGKLDQTDIRTLCASRTVALFGRSQFEAFGIQRTDPPWDSDKIDLLRQEMDRLHCLRGQKPGA